MKKFHHWWALLPPKSMTSDKDRTTCKRRASLLYQAHKKKTSQRPNDFKFYERQKCVPSGKPASANLPTK